MSGFTLYAQEKPLQVLDWRDLEALVRAGRIDWPDIKEEEIKDKSKDDYLSKSIVVLQSTWFIVQFFARAASKLTITELEVVTLAFASLIGVIYYLWWNKPLNVRCSVPVHLKEGTTEQATSDNVTDNGSSSECFRFPPPLGTLPTVFEGEERPDVDQIKTDNLSPSSFPNFPSPQSTLQNSGSNFVPTMTIHPPPEPPFQIDGPLEPATSFNWKNLYLRVWIVCRKCGIFLGLVLEFISLVIGNLFGYQFYDMVKECTLKTDIQKPNHPFNPLRSGPLRVPTFYSNTAITRHRVIFAICASILFGAIHFVAWHYEFPTPPERYGWRTSSIIVSVVPLILLPMHVAGGMKIVKKGSIYYFFADVFSFAYICSRIALLIFPLISLRALPPGAYVDFDWVSVIPHI